MVTSKLLFLNNIRFLFALFFSCFLISLSSIQAEDDTEYDVELGGGVCLYPTAILYPSSSGHFSQEYIQQLVDILSYDININGMMSLIEEKERGKIQNCVAKSSPYLPLGEIQKITPLSYLIRCHTDGSSLVVDVTTMADGSMKKCSPIPLTNTLSIDRGRIHQLADFIFYELFGSKGIASTRILYSKKFVVIEKNKKQSTVSSKAEIYLCDYDGGNEKKLTSLNSVSVTPQWIETNGQKPATSFLFVSYLIGQPKIYIASMKGAKLIRLSPMRGNQLTPAVSRNGKKVAFCSDISGSSDLYLLSFDPKIGEISKPRQIYKTASCATACPAFSPDSASMAFVSNKDGSPKIYVMPIPDEMTKLKEIKPKLITRKCRENSAPTWSPDGKKIAYAAKHGGDARQIWVYDIERDSEYQITRGPGNKENPSWAPNSLHLTYQGVDEKGTWSIYVINLNQKKPVKITSGLGDNQFPAWEI